MYKAYLSYGQLKEYLSILIANGLLEENESEKLYRTTEKGHQIHEDLHPHGRTGWTSSETESVVPLFSFL